MQKFWISIFFAITSFFFLRQTLYIIMRPVSFYDATFSLSLFRLQFDGAGVERIETSDTFSWYGKIVNNFRWRKSRFQLTGNYNSPVATPQGKSMATYYMDFGYQQQLQGNTNDITIEYQ